MLYEELTIIYGLQCQILEFQIYHYYALRKIFLNSFPLIHLWTILFQNQEEYHFVKSLKLYT